MTERCDSMNDDPYDYLDADYEEYLRKEGKMMDSQDLLINVKKLFQIMQTNTWINQIKKKLQKKMFL